MGSARDTGRTGTSFTPSALAPRQTRADWREAWILPPAHRRLVALLAAVGCLTAIALVILPRSTSPPPDPAPTTPAYLDLRSVYFGSFSCHAHCTRWTGRHDLLVPVPSNAVPTLADDVIAVLSAKGWELSTRGDPGPVSADDPPRLHFERNSIAQTPLPSWRPSRARNLAIPQELFAQPLVVRSLPPGPAHGKVDRPLDAVRNGVLVRIVPSAESAVVLMHSRYAVAATSPTSTATDAAAQQQERRVSLANAAVSSTTSLTVDMVAPWARTEAGLFLAVRSPWLLLLAALTACVLAGARLFPARLRASASSVRARGGSLFRRLAARLRAAARFLYVAVGTPYRRYVDHRTGVVITESSVWYHTSTCAYFGPHTLITRIRRSKAKSEGRRPCGGCQPG